MNKVVARFFHNNLSEENTALNYKKKRKINLQTIKQLLYLQALLIIVLFRLNQDIFL